MMKALLQMLHDTIIKEAEPCEDDKRTDSRSSCSGSRRRELTIHNDMSMLEIQLITVEDRIEILEQRKASKKQKTNTTTSTKTQHLEKANELKGALQNQMAVLKERHRSLDIIEGCKEWMVHFESLFCCDYNDHASKKTSASSDNKDDESV